MSKAIFLAKTVKNGKKYTYKTEQKSLT